MKLHGGQGRGRGSESSRFDGWSLSSGFFAFSAEKRFLIFEKASYHILCLVRNSFALVNEKLMKTFPIAMHVLKVAAILT